MFGKRDKEDIVKMAIEIGALKARVDALERKEWQYKPSDAAENDPAEIFNKQLTDGLKNLLSYDGTVNRDDE